MQPVTKSIEAAGIASLRKGGDIVIPKAVRDHLGLEPGDRFVMACSADSIVLKKVRTGRGRV